MDFFNDNKNIIIIVVFILFIFSICLNLYLFNESQSNSIECDNTCEVNSEENISKCIVEIKGAVKKPNVYEVDSNSIIKDIVDLAGGFKNNAYTNNINLSKKINNEMVIYVYSKNEYNNNNSQLDLTTCESNTYNIENCINENKSIITTTNEEVLENKNNSDSKININTASKEELMNVSGLGEKKAESIIEYRKNTLFNKIEDIKNVSGIGEALFEKIKDNITV